jgi:hypothetical protein
MAHTHVREVQTRAPAETVLQAPALSCGGLFGFVQRLAVPVWTATKAGERAVRGATTREQLLAGGTVKWGATRSSA